MPDSVIPEPMRATDRARLEMTQLVPGPEMPIREIYRRICEISATTLDVVRASIWFYADDRQSMRCANLFERRKGEHSSGILLWVADFPMYFASLERRRTIPAEVAQSDDRTTELTEGYLKPLGITSMLDAPILIGGQVIGVICYEHVGPEREWSTEERDFAGSAADIIALKIRSSQLLSVEEKLQVQRVRIATLEKSEALGQMAAGIAHDFNNLLTVICGNATLLQSRDDLPAEIREAIDQVAAAGQRGSNMVRDLLQFARRSRNTPIAIELASAIEAFLPMLQQSVGNRHPVQFSKGSDSGHVLMDRDHFERILLNLCINARDAMPDGGAIVIELSVTHAEQEPGDGTSRFVTVNIRDTGTGIDSETLKRVFDPYFTTKKEGTGLGLALVKKFTEEAGGFIRISSALGLGTSIRLYFPRLGFSSTE